MSSPTQLKIGHFISELRIQRGLTQSELAKLIGTSQSAMARMEKGEQNFSTEMLAKIGQALNRPIITLPDKSLTFKIVGGQPLSGKVTVLTSKNAAVSLLCASLLNNGKTVLKQMPRIEEVNRIIEVLISIGVSVKWIGKDLEIAPPAKLNLNKLNLKSAMRTRSILMFLGPLIHWLPEFRIPYPGGCKIGRRIVSPHLFALEKLGVSIETTKGFHYVKARNLHAGEIVMYESSDTAVENALMAAARLPGKTTIKFATSNYMVQDLCFFLQKLGVKIDGVGTSTLAVYGKPDIGTSVTYQPSEDPIEAMLFLSIAATTNSSFTIQRCPIDFLELELLKLEKMGFKYKIIQRYKANNGFTNLVDIKTFKSNLVALPEKIHPLPYPGLNIDNLPFFVPIATQAKGQTLIHDWIYENRAIYYLDLVKLGADMTLADPHRIFINGPTKLRGAEIISPPALRPAAINLIAMLAASGTSILRNVYSINRGYEDLAHRLQALGAKIEVMSGI